MKLVRWEDFARGRERIGPFAATIGVFDGVHLGHRELIGRIMGKPGMASAVVTFEGNPKRSLHAPAFRGDVLTLAQRTEIISSLGADVILLIDFSGDFGKLPGREFLSFLSAGGDLRFLAVGHDFRCGSRLDTGAEEIRDFCAERGIEVEFVRAVRVDGHPVSSSRIRSAIAEGRLEEAEALMGRPFELDLRGAEANEAGRVEPSGGQASPPEGTYEVEAESGGVVAAFRAAFRDGAWDLGAAARGRPEALRLLKLVSRE
jgi:riboflavin kinase / FMN adenylyltransferase